MVRDIWISADKSIGPQRPVFTIAEIGQNHQGDLATAKRLISAAKDSGADCVKFQKTCIYDKFTAEFLSRPYTSANSWGHTYADHKQHLEFTSDEFEQLKSFADAVGVAFSATAMDLASFKYLQGLRLPFIKIGSGDCNNVQLLEYAASTGIPLILSTGMHDFDVVRRAYDTVRRSHDNFCMLHCVSSYPAPLEDINLNVLRLYKRHFGDVSIGYSGHEVGNDVAVAAVAMGAKVIERHFTLDKGWKGSDHCCSLLPQEFRDMVERIRAVEKALGVAVKAVQPSEQLCRGKFCKTLTYAKDLGRGHVLRHEDVRSKVAGMAEGGVDAALLHSVLGSALLIDAALDQPLQMQHLRL